MLSFQRRIRENEGRPLASSQLEHTHAVGLNFSRKKKKKIIELFHIVFGFTLLSAVYFHACNTHRIQSNGKFSLIYFNSKLFFACVCVRIGGWKIGSSYRR